MNELRFNIFTFIALLSKNIRQITFIIFLSLSCGVFYYISSDYKYTVKANLVSLEPIQNSLTSIGFTDTELFNLFLYNIYNKELIRSSYIALEEDINVENADSDEFIYKLTKSLRIERGENKDVDIIYQDEDSSFAEKFLRVHIINVKTETLKSLRTVIEGNIRRNSLKLNSAKMLEDEKKKISLMNLRKSLDLINEFYLDEKENLLNYIEQNIKIAEAMDQILPVEAIISENAQSISNFSKDLSDEQKINNRTNYSNDTKIISAQSLIKTNRFLDLPSYLFGTKILNEVYNSIKSEDIPEIREEIIFIKKRIKDISGTNEISTNKTNLLQNLSDEKIKLDFYDILSKQENIPLFNFNGVIEVKSGRIKLPFLLIISFTVGLIVSILYSIPYKRMINHENEQLIIKDN